MFQLTHHYTFLQKGRNLFYRKREHCIIATWSGKRTRLMAQIGIGCIVTGFSSVHIQKSCCYLQQKAWQQKCQVERNSLYYVFQIILLDAKFSGWTHSKTAYISNQKQILFYLMVRGVHKCRSSHWFTWIWEMCIWKYFCVLFCCHLTIYVQKVQKKMIWEEVSALDFWWWCGLDGSLGFSDS